MGLVLMILSVLLLLVPLCHCSSFTTVLDSFNDSSKVSSLGSPRSGASVQRVAWRNGGTGTGEQLVNQGTWYYVVQRVNRVIRNVPLVDVALANLVTANNSLLVDTGSVESSVGSALWVGVADGGFSVASLTYVFKESIDLLNDYPSTRVVLQTFSNRGTTTRVAVMALCVDHKGGAARSSVVDVAAGQTVGSISLGGWTLLQQQRPMAFWAVRQISLLVFMPDAGGASFSVGSVALSTPREIFVPPTTASAISVTISLALLGLLAFVLLICWLWWNGAAKTKGSERSALLEQEENPQEPHQPRVVAPPPLPPKKPTDNILAMVLGDDGGVPSSDDTPSSLSDVAADMLEDFVEPRFEGHDESSTVDEDSMQDRLAAAQRTLDFGGDAHSDYSGAGEAIELTPMRTAATNQSDSPEKQDPLIMGAKNVDLKILGSGDESVSSPRQQNPWTARSVQPARSTTSVSPHDEGGRGDDISLRTMNSESEDAFEAASVGMTARPHTDRGSWYDPPDTPVAGDAGLRSFVDPPITTRPLGELDAFAEPPDDSEHRDERLPSPPQTIGKKAGRNLGTATRPLGELDVFAEPPDDSEHGDERLPSPPQTIGKKAGQNLAFLQPPEDSDEVAEALPSPPVTLGKKSGASAALALDEAAALDSLQGRKAGTLRGPEPLAVAPQMSQEPLVSVDSFSELGMSSFDEPLGGQKPGTLRGPEPLMRVKKEESSDSLQGRKAGTLRGPEPLAVAPQMSQEPLVSVDSFSKLGMSSFDEPLGGQKPGTLRGPEPLMRIKKEESSDSLQGRKAGTLRGPEPLAVAPQMSQEPLVSVDSFGSKGGISSFDEPLGGKKAGTLRGPDPLGLLDDAAVVDIFASPPASGRGEDAGANNFVEPPGDESEVDVDPLPSPPTTMGKQSGATALAALRSRAVQEKPPSTEFGQSVAYWVDPADQHNQATSLSGIRARGNNAEKSSSTQFGQSVAYWVDEEGKK